MRFSDNWLRLITLVLILATVGLLHVARAKRYVAKNAVEYWKFWHTNGSVTLMLSKNGQHFAYHTNPEAHKHGTPIYQITLKNVLCDNVKCATCNPAQQEVNRP